MSRRRFLIASDIHWCHIDWYGVKNDDRMQLFVKHVKEEYEKDPFEALLLLGDYSLDHWKWNVQGCWLKEGRSNTRLFCDRVLAPLKELGVPMAVIAGNHEQYGRRLWQAITGGFKRQDVLVTDDVLFILPDTFGADLDPTEHSDGTYCGTDVKFVRAQMEKYPDKKVVLCAHHFEPGRESEAFKKLVREDDRILCLFGGHVHRSLVVELGEEWGNKALLYTGNYSYNGGKQPPTESMWGFRDLILTDGELHSRYITPANTIVVKDETIEHPYGYQDEYRKSVKM